MSDGTSSSPGIWATTSRCSPISASEGDPMADDLDHAPLPAEILADIERTGTADLAIGLATIGTSQGIADKAAAIRAGLDAHFSGHTAVIIHVDYGPSDEPSALLSQVLGERRVLRARSSHDVEA